LDAPITNYRGVIVSLYYLPLLLPHLLPSRVTYASVFLELSFLTSSKFKGLKSISIWNSLLQWQSFAQGAQTHPSSQWLTCCQEGLQSHEGRKGKNVQFAHKTRESPSYLIFKCKAQLPWLGLYQNKGWWACHLHFKKYLKKAKKEIWKLKYFTMQKFIIFNKIL